MIQTIATILPYIQIVLSILLVGGVLLQQTGSSVGGAFGGSDNMSAGFHTRRGAERVLFRATIVIAILFALTAFLALLI